MSVLSWINGVVLVTSLIEDFSGEPGEFVVGFPFDESEENLLLLAQNEGMTTSDWPSFFSSALFILLLSDSFSDLFVLPFRIGLGTLSP